MIIKIHNINKFFMLFIPIFFALPEMSINMGIINLRYDDIIVYILLILNIGSIGKITFFLYNSFFYRVYSILIIYAFISILFVILISDSSLLRGYNLTKSIGSMHYFIVLPYLFSKKEYRDFFYMGVFVGGIIYILSIYSNYIEVMRASLFQEGSSASFKKHMSFSTLNPNAVATLAAILGWANLLGYLEHKKRVVLPLVFILMMIPFFIFARSMSIGLIIGFLFFIFGLKIKLKNILIISSILLIIFIGVIFYVDLELLNVATNINISTGEGFHGRFRLWYEGLELIQKSFIFGHGLSTENNLYIKYFDGGLSHNLYLHYLIELGIIGLLLFLIAIIFLFHNRYLLYRKNGIFFYRVQISVMISFLVADIGGQLLYINKYAFLIYILSTINLGNENKYVQKL
jgi:O-antigen ligase